jgi:ribosomal protein S18 acetylase RimI-like enzyme
VPEVVLRPLSRSDLPAVARIHGAAFPASFLTALGPRTVERYYAWQLLGPHDIAALGAYVEEDLVGFCFGGLFRGAMSGFLRRNRIFLISQVLTRPALWKRALFRKRLLEGIRILRKHSVRRVKPVTAAGLASPSKSFGILSIAVDPKYQGWGVGRLLMDRCDAIARRDGFRGMHLTVNSGNEQAIRFYETLGWMRSLEGGEWKGKFEKLLSP